MMEEDRRSCMTRATTRGGMGFEDLCRGGLQASYVIDTQCLVNVTAEDSLEQAQRKLVCKIDELFKDICMQRDATIKQFYVGKTFLQTAKRSKSLNQMEPKTWRRGGISSRWGTHKKEEYGKDGMLVIGVITKSQVPTQRDSNKPVVDQEQYTLALEQRLIQHYRITRKDTRIHNATFTCGGADKKGSAGYALYVAFSLEEDKEVIPMSWEDFSETEDEQEQEQEGCSHNVAQKDWVPGQQQQDTMALSDAINYSNTTTHQLIQGTHQVMHDYGVSIDPGDARNELHSIPEKILSKERKSRKKCKTKAVKMKAHDGRKKLNGLSGAGTPMEEGSTPLIGTTILKTERLSTNSVSMDQLLPSVKLHCLSSVCRDNPWDNHLTTNIIATNVDEQPRDDDYSNHNDTDGHAPTTSDTTTRPDLISPGHIPPSLLDTKLVTVTNIDCTTSNPASDGIVEGNEDNITLLEDNPESIEMDISSPFMPPHMEADYGLPGFIPRDDDVITKPASDMCVNTGDERSVPSSDTKPGKAKNKISLSEYQRQQSTRNKLSEIDTNISVPPSLNLLCTNHSYTLYFNHDSQH